MDLRNIVDSDPNRFTSRPASRPLGSRLEQFIGRPSAEWNADDLVTLVRGQGIRLVSLMHVGGDGWLKTLDFAPRDTAHLHAIFSGGERADGSSLFPGLGIAAGTSDVVLRPRIATAFLDPFAPVPTLAVLCGHAGRDGHELPQSPDTLIRRAHARLEHETGFSLHALGEVEYFLGRRVTPDDVYGATERGYHATAPFVFGEPLRRRALAILSEMGVPVKYAHAEVGYVEPAENDSTLWEQHEIELGLAPLPAAADAVVLTHWVLRNLARAEGLWCNFDPVLRRGHAGTGLHFHFSPVLRGEHQPTRDDAGRLTDPARWLIAALVTHGGALMAFGNRLESSFIRVGQAKEAPSELTWGEFDRNALVRLPIVARDAAGQAVSPPTIEFRLPDGSAHPHLLLAGVAQAMVAARGAAGLDALLDATASGRTSAGVARAEGGLGTAVRATAVPQSFGGIAVELARLRVDFEAGDVFPQVLIDAVMGRLEAAEL